MKGDSVESVAAGAPFAGMPVKGTSWLIGNFPDGWEPVQELGMQRTPEGDFTENLVCGQDTGSQHQPLRTYVDRQLGNLGLSVNELRVEHLGEANAFPCDEDLIVRLGFTYLERSLCQYQYYLKRGTKLGFVTWSTRHSDETKNPDRFRDLLSCLAFR
jgi:hypothetical protein